MTASYRIEQMRGKQQPWKIPQQESGRMRGFLCRGFLLPIITVMCKISTGVREANKMM